jgi:hypothetical protein
VREKRPDAAGDEVIFEIIRIGDIQRCAAIHAATGIEVVIQAPGAAARVDVQSLAMRKLKRALARAETAEEAARHAASRRGKRLY